MRRFATCWKLSNKLADNLLHNVLFFYVEIEKRVVKEWKMGVTTDDKMTGFLGKHIHLEVHFSFHRSAYSDMSIMRWALMYTIIASKK